MELTNDQNVYKNIIGKLLTIFLCLIPVIDMINGYNLLNETSLGSKVGILFRIATLFLLGFIILYKISRKYLILLYTLLTLLISVVVINYFRTQSVAGLADEITYATKLVLPIFYVLGISNAVNRKIIKPDTINKVLVFFSVGVPFTLIIPVLLGVGYTSYALGGGFKGFYFSNNELNVLMISITIYVFWQLIETKKRVYLLLLLLNIFAMLMIGSKTSIACIAVLVVLYIFKKFNIFSIIKVLVGAVIAGTISSLLFQSFFENLVFRFQYYYIVTEGNDNILNFFFSNRNLRVQPAFTKIYLTGSINSLLNFLFGYGHYQQFDANRLYSIMEMDILDTLIWYGFLVTIYIAGFYIWLMYKGFKSHVSRGFLVIYIIIFIFSLLAGHVMYSALAGGIFGIIGSQFLLVAPTEEKDKLY
ncbi:hypothetical protein GIX45_07440 [Erwinia sp. CPCC 100877]|nr:hypothetical protein [Erwinia sp. CPCC 100877]